MSKYINEYNKEHYSQVIIYLKPNEKELLDKKIKKLKLSRREFILKILNDEEV